MRRRISAGNAASWRAAAGAKERFQRALANLRQSQRTTRFFVRNDAFRASFRQGLTCVGDISEVLQVPQPGVQRYPELAPAPARRQNALGDGMADARYGSIHQDGGLFGLKPPRGPTSRTDIVSPRLSLYTIMTRVAAVGGFGQ